MQSCKSVLLTGVVAGVLASGPAMAQTLEILSAEGDPASVEAMNWAIGEFQKEHPGVEVDYQVVSWTDLGKKIVASTAAGQPPDVVHLDDFGASVLSGQGLLEPADDVVAAIGTDDYFPIPLESVTMDGTVWGVPFSNGFNLLWYRKDLYEKHGLEAPKTWDELLKNASTLNGEQSDAGEIYGIALALNNSNHTNDTVQAFMWSNGATIIDADGNVAIDSPEALAAYEFEKELFAYAPPGAAQHGNLEVLNAFATGRVAHSIYPARMVLHVLRTNPELADKTGVTVIPKGPSPDARYASTMYTKAWGFPKGADNTALGKEFVTFLETGEREVRWLHSVPVHFWPPRRSTATSDAYKDNPALQSGIGQAASTAILDEALPNAQPQLSEAGVINPDVFKILQANVLATLMQKIVLSDTTVEAAAEEATEQADELLAR